MDLLFLMKKTTKVIAGKKAQKSGTQFEEMFQAFCYRQSIEYTRIPDGCKQIGQARIIRVKSPFDYIITYNGMTAVIDTKSTESDSFMNSLINSNQVLSMLKHDKYPTRSGYVVYLKKLQRVIFIPAKTLAKNLGIRGSVDQLSEGVIDLGHEQSFNIKLIFNAQ